VAWLPSLGLVLALGIDTFAKPSWWNLLAYPIGALAGAVLQVAILPSLAEWLEHGGEPPRPQLRGLLGGLRAALGAALLSAAISLVMSLPYVVVMQLQPTFMPGLGTVLAGLVWYPLCIWLSLRLALIVVVAILERQGAVAAARRSWLLTRGQLLPTLGVALAIGIVAGLVTIAVMLFLLLGVASNKMALAWAGIFVGLVMMPVYVALPAVLHHEFLRRAGGHDGRRLATGPAPG
jgi:hypothetical protein